MNGAAVAFVASTAYSPMIKCDERVFFAGIELWLSTSNLNLFSLELISMHTLHIYSSDFTYHESALTVYELNKQFLWAINKCFMFVSQSVDWIWISYIMTASKLIDEYMNGQYTYYISTPENLIWISWNSMLSRPV